MAKVFISYASEDKQSAERLEYWLTNAGHHAWRDRSQLVPGSRWSIAIDKAIGECDVMIALLSDAAYRSVNCENEYETAGGFNRHIIPVVLDGTSHLPMRFRAVVRIPFVENSILSALVKCGFPEGRRLGMGDSSSAPEILPEILLGSDLRSLIANYDETEKELTIELVTLFQKHLESLGATVKGQMYELDGTQYTFYWEQSAVDRELDLILVPASGKNRGRRYSETLSRIGRIRKITIRWPLERDVDVVLHELKEKASRTYSALQVSFESRYAGIRGVLFTNLYELLKQGLIHEERARHFRRLALTVTTTKTSVFTFHFSPDQISFIMEELQRTQQPRISPFEYLVSLLIEEPPDSFWSWNMLSTDDFTVLPLDKLQGASSHDKNWKAQAIFLKSDNIAVRELCRTQIFSLQLNIPADLTEVLNPAVDVVSKELDRQFRENELVFLGHRDAIQKVARQMTTSESYYKPDSVASTVFQRMASWFGSRERPEQSLRRS